MKTEKLMIIAITTTFLLLSSIMLLANNERDGKNKKVKNYINARIDYPENDEDISGFVIVEYKVDTAGAVGINAINASHSKLKTHVESAIKKLADLPSADVKDTIFICKYVFVSHEKYISPKKSKGMKSVIDMNEFTAEK